MDLPLSNTEPIAITKKNIEIGEADSALPFFQKGRFYESVTQLLY